MTASLIHIRFRSSLFPVIPRAWFCIFLTLRFLLSTSSLVATVNVALSSTTSPSPDFHPCCNWTDLLLLVAKWQSCVSDPVNECKMFNSLHIYICDWNRFFFFDVPVRLVARWIWELRYLGKCSGFARKSRPTPVSPRYSCATRMCQSRYSAAI